MRSVGFASLAASGALAAVLLTGVPASAHIDPPGCTETGPAIVVSVFRADGTTGLSGVVSECETIQYRARLQKAENNDTICAFSGGTFSLTTPDGIVHSISANVPCIGGTADEGCVLGTVSLESALFPYTVAPGDIVGGLIVATAQYTGGVVHDSADNTAGASATTPRSIPVFLCTDNDLCTNDVCDPNVAGSAACSNTPIVCNDNTVCTTDQCVASSCVFTPVNCDDNNLCTVDTCDPITGCANTPVVCNDNNLCTSDACNPATGTCVFTPTVVCNDNSVCTTEACNPATGLCVFTPVTCNDGNRCTADICHPVNGCQTTPIDCNDNDPCTTDTCSPDTGCQQTPVVCNDNDVCTTDVCDPVEGCVSTPLPPGGGGEDDDSDSKSDSDHDGDSDSSDDGGGDHLTAQTTTGGDCDGDSDSDSNSDSDHDGDSDSSEDGDGNSVALAGANDSDHDSNSDSDHDGDSDSSEDHDSASHDCEPEPEPTCPTFCPCDDGDGDSDSGSDDNNDGDSDSSSGGDKSDTGNGNCIPNPACPPDEPPLCSCDQDGDSDSGSNDGDSDQHFAVSSFGDGGDDGDGDGDSDSSEDRDCRPNPDCPIPPVCRRSDYWANHGPTMKAVLGDAGCVEVCGEVIKNVGVASADSALEAICVSSYSTQKIKLVQQLTSMALNCIASGRGPSCGPVDTELGSLFKDCNHACTGQPSTLTASKCLAAVGCFNKGGTYVAASGSCKTGDDGDSNECNEESLPQKFQIWGSSLYSCWKSMSNKCDVVAPGEQNSTLAGCTAAGTESVAAETCPAAP